MMQSVRDNPRGSATAQGAGYLLHDERAIRLARRITAEGAMPTLRATRVVMFLSNRCNMRCQYCLSIRHKMPRWSPERVLSLLQQHAHSGAEHIQWTGGEASMAPDIVAYVRHASQAGMNNSMSTNGSAPAKRYKALVDAGMQRFYLSLDTLDPAEFDRITASRNYLPKVLQTIELLVRLRARNRALHITLNTILNRGQAKALMAGDGDALRARLRFLVESGVDDFKFLPDSTQSFAGIFPDECMAQRFLHICQSEVPRRYRMFHHRLDNIRGGGHGFHDMQPRHCYHCLDDRAYDSEGAWGCVIHIREGGRLIYRHGNSEADKRRKLADFVRQDRSRDPICRRCCFDLYRSINDRVAWLLENEPHQDELAKTAV